MAVLRVSRFVAALAIGLAGFGASASAAVNGPYTVDANTLHLWHLDDASGLAVDSVAGGLNLTNIDQSAQTSNAGNTATANAVYGSAAFSGFGSSVNFAGNALIPTTVNTGADATAPHRPILLGAAALNAADGDTVPFSFSSTPGAGTAGAFTFEAVIKFDGSFDPASTAYRNTGGAAGGAYPMEIFSGEGDANAARNWQFRVDQIGVGTSSGANGTTRPRLEFANLHQISGNQSLAWDLPIAGADAINNTDWFHVAVAYNGLEATAGNLSIYWTKVDPTNTAAHLLTTAQMTNDLSNATTDFAVGNEARGAAGSGLGEGESFVGSIDEVRISSVARGADQFIFAVPEPSTFVIAALGMVGLVGAARRRK